MDKFLYGCIYLSAAIAVSVLLMIICYVTVRGIGSVSLEFLSNGNKCKKRNGRHCRKYCQYAVYHHDHAGVATPIGVGSAIYLNEYAKPGKIVRIIEFTTETLSGIPSIIFGLFGSVFFGTTLKLGYSLLTGALTLSLMILPLITRNTQEALRTVPDSYRSGALGMGATKWHMIRTILLPSAMPGIITGVILAIGRIVGESAALLFTAGSGYLLPKAGGWLSKILQPGGTLTIQLYLSSSKAEYNVAFGIAFVLLVIVLCINFLTKYLAKRFDVTRMK